MTRMNDPRRDRKILVTVCLAGSQVTRGGHQLLTTFIDLARAMEKPAHTGTRAPYRGIRRRNQCLGAAPAGWRWLARRGLIGRCFSAPGRRPPIFARGAP